MELGAGIGRFTAEIAPEATSVIALDFMQNLIDQNELSNGHLGNIDFRCGDATQLALPPASADIVRTRLTGGRSGEGIHPLTPHPLSISLAPSLFPVSTVSTVFTFSLFTRTLGLLQLAVDVLV